MEESSSRHLSNQGSDTDLLLQLGNDARASVPVGAAKGRAPLRRSTTQAGRALEGLVSRSLLPPRRSVSLTESTEDPIETHSSGL